jgi:hypothetical protein
MLDGHECVERGIVKTGRFPRSIMRESITVRSRWKMNEDIFPFSISRDWPMGPNAIYDVREVQPCLLLKLTQVRRVL